MEDDLPDLQHATIRQLQHGLTAGRFTSLDLVKTYIARVEEVNHVLKAVISVSPAAFKAARNLDAERRQGKLRSQLHGIPIGIKDNISTRVEDGMDTTAGSFALQGSHVAKDADCVANLREAGKLNLSQWANFRGVGIAGWSSVGGQCTSPYYPRGNPSGSSSGSAVAAAVGLVCVTLGTETGGSIISPACRNALVGIRPTVGLVSAHGVIPVTTTRDAVGPLARTVEDAAIVLAALSGQVERYSRILEHESLSGLTLLAPSNLTNWSHPSFQSGHRETFSKALHTLRQLGLNIVEAPLSPEFLESDRAEDASNCTIETEFARDMDQYLATLKHVPSGIQTLKDLVRYTKEDPRESPFAHDSCKLFEAALARDGPGSEQYLRAKAVIERSRTLIELELDRHDAAAMVLFYGVSAMWGRAGCPQVTVPLGCVGPDEAVTLCTVKDKEGGRMDNPLGLLETYPNRPYGIVFAGKAGSEDVLLKIAHAFEQATQFRQQAKTYKEATPTRQLKDLVASEGQTGA